MIHSTQVCIPLKPLFSRHKGAGVQFTDEPTGNLDEKTRKIVENIFDDLNKKAGKTILLVTHDLEFAQKAKRRYALKEGRLRK